MNGSRSMSIIIVGDH